MGLLDRFDWEGDADAIQAIMEEQYPGLFAAAYDEAGGALPVAVSFDVNNPAIKKTIASLAKRIRGVSDSTRADIQALVDQQTENGWSMTKLAQAIRDQGAINSKSRSETIARTESATAYNLGATHAYEDAGITHVEVLDGDSDAHCADANGQTWTLAQARENPIAHPNCLVGGTLVVAPYQLRRESFTRWFDGEVITIRTAQDDFLTCTPNHPVLTTRGWVAAGELNETSYVIGSLDSKGVSALLDPNDNYMPARIEEIACPVGMPGSMTALTMPSAAEDFHGDGGGSEVYVVDVAGPLRVWDDTPPLKHIEEGSFERLIVDAASLATLSAFDKLLMGHLAAAPGFIGFDSDGTAVVGAHPLIKDALRIRPVTADPGLTQTPPDATRLDTEDGSEVVRAFARLIAPVQVVKVERSKFSGHVYNLRTVQGWYIANGIITHNCTRAFAPVVE